MSAALILNPAAGGGTAGRRWARVARSLEQRIGAVAVHVTAGPGDASQLARSLRAAGCGLLIAAGGDGTLHEVVNGLLPGAANVRLGVLPLGSGRDFARSLGLRGVEDAIDVLAAGEVRAIDAIRVRLRGARGETIERYCLNVASVGLGAVAARGALGRWRMLPASLRYLGAALPALAASTGYPVRISVAGAAPREYRITTLALANGRYQGGGILIAPQAALDDGMLDVTLVERVGIIELAAHARMLYSGAILSHAKVRHWRAASVQVESDADVPVELDGEPSGTLPLEAHVLPGVLRVMQAPMGRE